MKLPQALARSLLKKSLFENGTLRKWDIAVINKLFPHTVSQHIAILWPKVGRQRKEIFRVGAYS